LLIVAQLLVPLLAKKDVNAIQSEHFYDTAAVMEAATKTFKKQKLPRQSLKFDEKVSRGKPPAC
jgi:hypothetical protein